MPQLRRNLVRDLAALNKTEMLLWEDWGVLDSHTAPGPGELPVLDQLAALTGQPSPPLADLRSAYRRPEFVVPDTVTSYRDQLQPRPDRCPGGRRRQRGGPGSQLTGALARLAARPGGIALLATFASLRFGELAGCGGKTWIWTGAAHRARNGHAAGSGSPEGWPEHGDHAPDLGRGSGAGEGNRTLMTSLEGWGSTIELRPRSGKAATP